MRFICFWWNLLYKSECHGHCCLNWSKSLCSLPTFRGISFNFNKQTEVCTTSVLRLLLHDALHATVLYVCYGHSVFPTFPSVTILVFVKTSKCIIILFHYTYVVAPVFFFSQQVFWQNSRQDHPIFFFFLWHTVHEHAHKRPQQIAISPESCLLLCRQEADIQQLHPFCDTKYRTGGACSRFSTKWYKMVIFILTIKF